MKHPRDTAEQVAELRRAGAIREIELDGCGIWAHPANAGVTWYGAANALAALHGEPLPFSSNLQFPWRS